jgi:hypothetical protein
MWVLPLLQKRDVIIRELLKTPKSGLAIETKAEFTKVNEHFADRAQRRIWAF